MVTWGARCAGKVQAFGNPPYPRKAIETRYYARQEDAQVWYRSGGRRFTRLMRYGFSIATTNEQKPKAMANLIKTAEQLTDELLSLRRENRSLQAQLIHHKKLIDRIQQTLVNQPSRMTSWSEPALHPPVSAEVASRLQRLTRREIEVLRHIGQGLTSKEMATQMGISKLTIDTHRKRIQKKLEVSNTVELVKFAVEAQKHLPVG